MSYFYLASPYSHKNPGVSSVRAMQVIDVCAMLYDEGRAGFCPIAHSHAVALRMNNPLHRDSYEHWMRVDLPILRMCTVLYVLTISGWSQSDGVEKEVFEAAFNGIPVKYIDIHGRITDEPNDGTQLGSTE